MADATEGNEATIQTDDPPIDIDQQDEDLITSLLNTSTHDAFDAGLFDPDRAFDQRGKADDAVDYEDIDDDDLPDDEDQAGPGDDALTEADGFAEGEAAHPEVDLGYEDDPGDALDDLFGDGGAADGDDVGDGEISKQEGTQMSHEQLPRLHIPDSSGVQKFESSIPATSSGVEPFDASAEEELEELDAATRDQQRLLAEARAKLEGKLPPPPPEDESEFIETTFPDYNPDEPALFFRLFSHKKAYYASRNVPLKPPKPIQPTKVNLEICQDQEKTFTLTHGTATCRLDADAYEKIGLELCNPLQGKDNDEHLSLDDDTYDENERIGGLTMADITMLCTDWAIDAPSDSDEELGSPNTPPSMTEEAPDTDGWDTQPHKRRKISEFKHLPTFYESFPSLDDPEATTAYLSRQVVLDLNDPKMLVVDQTPGADQHPMRPGDDFRRDVSGSLMKALNRKYNFSNDEAYDRLKDNHSHKIRSTIGNLNVEHSLPALKLQYPFYKVKLNPREARSFHRPTFAFFRPNQQIRFTKRGSRKRKDIRPLPIKEAFDASSQLTLNDNSDIALFEYSEEYPMMMSNFGMGIKLVNYYRRRDEDDNDRPKFSHGETQVLLPQDKSPFSIFGNIEPGGHQPTLHNSMFRAPVWLHKNNSSDFIIGCSRTGEFGQQWFLRNLQNTYVVGQQFPSVEVPGTHARKVTEAAKRRLKMISWRIWRRYVANPRANPSLTNDEIKKHLPGTDIPQNRSKMREFMNYDKETSTWKPSPSDPIPADLAGIRALLRPEDVCLLDAMQVGHRHLLDAGYNKDDPDAEEMDDEDGDKDGDSLEQQLAPWHLTKNFLNACQSKAMLELHGEGDPSGRGEAISFIKTSMKGGFKAVGESIEDKLDAKRLKDTGGHSYNVAKQQRAYDISIKHIWEAQKKSLSADAEHSDLEPDIDDAPNEDARDTPGLVSRTPRSEIGTPAPSAFSRRGEDDSASAFSHYSTNSQRGKVLRITRTFKDKFGKEEKQEEVIHDPAVIRAYLKRRKALELANITDFEMTGDPEVDAMKRKAAEKELARLHRNKERRHAREKAKGKLGPGDGDGDDAGKVIGTQRKCANCGQVGHIKTNKKLCPLLNGTQRVDNPFDDSAFGTPVVSTPVVSTPRDGDGSFMFGGGQASPPPAGSPGVPPPPAFSP